MSAPQSVAQRSFSTSSSIDERDGGVADVRVDLHQEVAADDHRLELGVIDVGRDDGAAARDLAPHELGVEPFAQRDELHLRRDHALCARSAAASRAAPLFARQRRPRPGGDRGRHLARPGASARSVAGLPRRRRGRRSSRAGRAAGPRGRPRRCGPLVSYTRSGGSPPDKRDLPHRHRHGDVAGAAVDVHLAGIGKGGAVISRHFSLERRAAIAPGTVPL